MSNITADNISSIIKERIDNFELNIDITTTGKVISYADGIAEVYGIKNVMCGDLVEFDNKELGVVNNVNETSSTVVILGKGIGIKEGTNCTISDKKLEVPTGEIEMNKTKMLTNAVVNSLMAGNYLGDLMYGGKRKTASDIKCKEKKVAKRRAKNKMKKRS